LTVLAGSGPILVTGATGQVGHELVRAFAPLGVVHSPGRSELDLTRPETLRAAVQRLRPRIVLNAAAYTAVDRAESEEALCRAVNADAPGELAEGARRAGALFVHYSTDYVFDGTKGQPYVESDRPAPLNVYGASKLAGENAVAAAGGAYLVFRTSWVYGNRGANFLRTMLRLARERDELRVVSDQRGAPTWSRDIATATALAVRGILTSGDPSAAASELSGTYHLSSGGVTTWYDFARAILAGDPQRAEHRCTSVVPIETTSYPTPARRPRYSVLDNGKLRQRLAITLPEWSEQLALVLRGCS
jgi:dTDP-4-dehydrorhamnose reductase